MQVNILVEGITDEPVAKKLLKHAGLEDVVYFMIKEDKIYLEIG